MPREQICGKLKLLLLGLGVGIFPDTDITSKWLLEDKFLYYGTKFLRRRSSSSSSTTARFICGYVVCFTSWDIRGIGGREERLFELFALLMFHFRMSVWDHLVSSYKGLFQTFFFTVIKCVSFSHLKAFKKLKETVRYVIN